MKKIISILMISLMVLSLTACGGANNGTAGKESGSNEVIDNAELSHPSEDENSLNELRAKQEERDSSSSKVTYYNDLNGLILALENNKINLAYVGESVAKYVMSQNNKMGYVVTEYSLPNEYVLCMKEENLEMINLMSDTIKEMKDDGTLEDLVSKYIDGVIDGNEPDAIELPQIEGRPTMVVAITGDVPPMDYIRKDGTPAGFNVAFLKEISERCDVNIELSQVTADARAMALETDKVDCLFWTVIEQSPDARMSLKDVPKDAICTKPYYSTLGVNLYSKENEKTMNYINNRMQKIKEIH